jgi:hypothetical protein
MSIHGALRQSSIAQRTSSLWSDPFIIGEVLLYIAAGPRDYWNLDFGTTVSRFMRFAEVVRGGDGSSI